MIRLLTRFVACDEATAPAGLLSRLESVALFEPGNLSHVGFRTADHPLVLPLTRQA